MIMIRAIVRPEKSGEVMSALLDAGFPGITKAPVHGRGKQRGLKVGAVHYDELPKDLLLIVSDEENKDDIIRVILKAAKTGSEGAFGDGKIFVSQIEEVYTVSTGTRDDVKEEATV